MWGGRCLLRVGVLGISYKTADLSLREAIARGAQKIAGERARFFKHPTLVLSTCNRTEIYFSAEDLAEAHTDLLAFFRSQVEEPFEHKLYSYFGIDCFSHLCRVSAGLDSAILAESEIQHQVKLAYNLSAKILVFPGCFHYIFQKALRIGKLTRAQLPLETGSATLNGTLWQLAEHYFDDLSKVRLLLVGYSEINRRLASFLQGKGLKFLTLATRNPDAVRMEGVIVQTREILDAWREFDWIVCASSSQRCLIEGEGSGAQLIFDLSVPRNVDPEISGVALWNIEQINQIVERNRRAALNCLEQCEAFVEMSVHRSALLYRAKIERGNLLCIS